MTQRYAHLASQTLLDAAEVVSSVIGGGHTAAWPEAARRTDQSKRAPAPRGSLVGSAFPPIGGHLRYTYNPEHSRRPLALCPRSGLRCGSVT